MTLEQAINNVIMLLEKRLHDHFSEKKESFNIDDIELPPIKNDGTAFSQFLLLHHLSKAEYLSLTLSLIPHYIPSLLSNIIEKHLPSSGDFPELGGVKEEKIRAFLPTGETVLFLLAGSDRLQRLKFQKLFSTEHFFYKNEILKLDFVKKGIPKSTGKLILDEEYVELFLYGKNNLPKLSINFPATHLTTQQEWKDLILPNKTIAQIEEIKNWIEHQKTLMEDWGMNKRLKPGFRVLFHGVPGTGKTLTATLLGKYTGLDVFRIDLSMVVSKYIGETEKNLSTLFNKAQNKNWILFFDEADALFGKRTNVRDAHDKYANQEVSYLLQRIENYPGLVILASNFKTNIDAAFTRRFQAVIAFTMPQAEERFRIWSNSFPKKIRMAKDVDLKIIAEKFELSGSNIMNVVQFACLKALAKNTKTIKNEFILMGIKKEFEKEGKML